MNRFTICGLIAFSIFLLSGASSPAVKRIWTGAGADANASTAGNWDSGAPTANDDIVLDGVAPAGQKAMTWNTNITLSSWTQVGYTNIVTFLTKYSGFTNFAINGNCVISNGTWTHPANTGVDTAVDRLAVSVGGDLIIGANGQIDLTGKGYAAAKGPGAGTTANQMYRGASHGGLGGQGNKSLGNGLVMPLPTYGSFVEPATLGSGGNKAGGGCAEIRVAGTTRLDGSISATAAQASGRYSGPAGGSVWLITGRLEGNGQITAGGRGGTDATDSSGAGGGGRVAVILTSSTSFGNVTITAAGGKDSSKAAAAGTVYLQTKDQARGEGTLIIDNAPNSLSGDFPICTLMPEPSAYNETPDLSQLSRIVVTNGARLGLNTNTVFDFGAGNLFTSGYSDSMILVGGSNNISFPANFTIPTTYSLLINTTVSATGNWTVPNGAVLSHFKNYEKELYKFGLVLNGNLTVEAGGEINVDGCGYEAVTKTVYAGPAAGGTTSGYGAGYGGMGGIGYTGGVAKATYGSVISPTNIGSSAYHKGSGAIFLDIRGTTTVNGVISASLTNNTLQVAGISGGSIWLKTRHLTGSGLLNAAGKPSGYSSSNSGGGGGGGRISVVLTDSDSFGTVRMQANGGANTSASYLRQSGAAGTIYTQTKSQGKRGTLLIANDNRTLGAVYTNTLTLLPAPAGAVENELEWVSVVISNQSHVALTSDLEIGDLMIYTNTLNRLYLKGYTLSINSEDHTIDWTTNNIIKDGGEIIWSTYGAVFILM